MNVEFKRMRWRCRRGMKELDVALEYFVDNKYAALDVAGRAAFERVLAMEDPELYACMLGKERAADAEVQDVIVSLRRGA